MVSTPVSTGAMIESMKWGNTHSGPAWALVVVGCLLIAAGYGLAAVWAVWNPADPNIGAGLLVIAGLVAIALGIGSLIFLRVQAVWRSRRRS